MIEGGKEKEEDEFKKKRERFSQAIRRNHREEIFSKKRNIPEQENIQTVPHKEDHYIVDPRFEEHIRKLHKTRFYLESLGELVAAVNDSDRLQQHYGLIGIRKIMSVADQPPIQPIVDTGVIPKLIENMNQEQYPQLQLEATWALTNIASGTSQQCQSIVDKGGIPAFIRLLKSTYPGIVQQAIWALGNIASDSIFHRDTILRFGGIPNMIYAIQNQLKTNDGSPIEHSGWALSNLCRGHPLPTYEVIKDAIPMLAQLISSGQIRDKSIIADCCWAINYNTNSDNERIQVLLHYNLEKVLVRFLQENFYNLLVPSIRIIGHITMGNHKQTQRVLDHENFYDSLYALLNHEKRIVRAETCWIISNIAGGNQEQVDELLSHDDILGMVLNLFESDGSDVKRQICTIFSNLTEEGHPERVFNFLKSTGVIRLFFVNLTSQEYRLIRDCLENLITLLQFGQKMRKNNGANEFVVQILNLGGNSILEELQMHEERSIYDLVVKIMKQFFDLDESIDF